MTQETRTCQNCKEAFIIEPEDFAFYEKMQVPPPTFCPRCRLQRRLAFHNLFTLYKRPCDLCKKVSISRYPPEAPYTVYCPSCWWSDNWDPLSYGRNYDFLRPFFEQVNALWHTVPLQSVSLDLPAMHSSPYCNFGGHLKNCYLVFWGDYNENSAYGFFFVHNTSVFDSALTRSSELCYDTMHCFKNYRGVGLDHVTESLDCYFLRDCANCKNCFASANLRNKQYYIFNKPYTKEAYIEEIKKYDLGSHAAYAEVKRRAEEHWKNFPPKPRWDERSVNVTGNYVFESKNCKECFEIIGAENSKYLMMMTDRPVKDCYDVSGWGNNLELSYDCGVVGENSAQLRFCHDTGINVFNAEYSKMAIDGGSHLFGCVAVRKREYCILNKQYAKEDYQDLRAKIIQHMDAMPYTDKRGNAYRYGEFYPIEFSSHAYNETLAQKIFPLSKEEIINRGYRWREPDAREYAVTKSASELPDHIKDAPGSIADEVVACAACGKGFKIIPMELAFLRQMNLPLPRTCPFCRIGANFNRWVKKMRLCERVCGACGEKFETPYPAQEVPSILCKKFWQEQMA